MVVNFRRLGIAALSGIGAFFLAQTPVLANTPIAWAALAGGAPVVIGFSTAGVGFVLVCGVEAWVLSKYLKISIGKAIGATVSLNVISSLMGAFLSGMAYSSSFGVILFGLPGAIIFAFIAGRRGMPAFYGPIIFICLVVGTVTVYAVQGIIYQSNHFVAYLYMLFPLVLGFGLTLLYESIFAVSIIGHKDPWKALLKANIASYIVLSLLIPFSPVKLSIDSGWSYRGYLRGSIADGGTADEISGVIDRYYGSNLYLIGFTKKVNYPASFDAQFEIESLQRGAAWVNNADESTPEVGLAIINKLLSIETLTEDARWDLEQGVIYYKYWSNLAKIAADGDSDTFLEKYQEWYDWQMGSLQPISFASPYHLAVRMVRDYELDCELPEEEEDFNIPVPEPKPVYDPFGVLGGEDEISTAN